MPITLPNLDDRTWEELVAEGVSMIPAWAPQWTDHNPSDPGITLLELFAHVSEVLLYRLNRIPERHIRLFLTLIDGPKRKPGPDLDKSVYETARRLRAIRRAVTADDYQALALSVSGVARARCAPRRNLSRGDPAALITEAPGHVSLLVVPRPDARADWMERLRRKLDAARLVGTRVHICLPRTVPIAVRATLSAAPVVDRRRLRQEAVEALNRFFSPVTGGPEGTGWPFGRNVYASELCQVLQRVPGVDTVAKTPDSVSGRGLEYLAVPPSEAQRLKYNRLGELEAIALEMNELPNISSEQLSV